MTIGEKIKVLRKQKGYTQQDIANKLGIRKQTVTQYEHNIVTNIPMEKIKIMAKMFDVSPAYLLGIDELTLPTEHEVLCSLYDSCTDDGKKNIIAFAEFQSNQDNK